MKKFSVYSLITLLFLFCASTLSAQQEGYSIDVKINGLSNSKLVLGHHFAKAMYPDDTTSIDQNGVGNFTGNKKLIQGIYLLYFEDGSYFEVMIGEDQHFSIETDTGKYVENLKITGSLDNEIFSDFQLFLMNMQTSLRSLQTELQSAEDEKEKEKLKGKIQKLGDERVEKAKSIIDQYPDLFVSTFLKATLDIEVPDSVKDDGVARYKYYKAHYFDNFDIGDVRLLHTPLYEDKIMNYLDNVVIQSPDSIISEVDKILSITQSDSILFRYALITLFKKYGKSQYMGMDAVQVHIAEKFYIPHAWWSDDKYIDELKERVAVLKPLLIGQTAPNVQLRYVPKEHFIQAKNDTALKKYPHAGSFFKISDIEAEFTVLYFWEATCSHCKKSTPDMYKAYKDTLQEQNIQVISISTLFGEDGKQKWIDFVNKHGLYDWVNAWNPYSYDYKETYDVKTTPQIYLLNKDKEIIGKKLGVENIIELINAYKKHNN